MKLGIVAAFITHLIVITEPYKGIKHNQTNVYVFKKEYTKIVMEEYEPEDQPIEEIQYANYLDVKYERDKEWEK
jgi:hypothetical protein